MGIVYLDKDYRTLPGVHTLAMLLPLTMQLRLLVCTAICVAATSGKPSANNNDKPLDFESLSICINGTNGSELVPRKGKAACDETSHQVAVGRYANRVNTTGWNVLEVETFAGFSVDVQAFAAGMAEGELTRDHIHNHWRNTIEDLCKGYKGFCKKLNKYLQANLDWIKETVQQKGDEDLYWTQVRLVFTQMAGIHASYLRKEETTSIKPYAEYTINPVFMVQLSGELIDINKWLNKTPDAQEFPGADKCTSLLKVTNNNEDLLFSHVVVSALNTMTRVLKLYKFAFDKERVPGRIVAFSGYAGALSSADDYTLTSAGLAAIETTHDIFNHTLYDLYIKPEGQLHCWVRSYIADALAHTAKEWVDIFAKYNSGTYNNQWVVVDYKKFKKGKPLPDEDLVWILEQIPGYTETRDMTWFLKTYSYFPSYNMPYLSSITQMSGYAEKAKTHDWYRWGHTPRAKIFDRDHVKVVDLESIIHLMRFNDYKHEEFARCKCNPPYTAEGAISARGDLNPVNGTWELPSMGFSNHAGLDCKGTNYDMFSKLRFRAWGGPPYGPIPPFDWSTTNVKANHYGHPTVWNFSYVDLAWETQIEIDGFPPSSQ